MAESDESNSGDSLRRAMEIDSICDAFEELLQRGERPSIEQFLERTDASQRGELLVELVGLEVSYRKKAGETFSESEYLVRFPGLSSSQFEETLQHPPAPKADRKAAAKLVADSPTIDSVGERRTPQAGTVVKYFGDYELLDVIARGGMGIVYRARQMTLNRIVALKMILSAEFASHDEIDRFYNEAQAAALLDHPGIVPIYEVGEHEGKHFYSMTYVEGESLADKTSTAPLAPKMAAEMMKEVAEAVEYAHQKGIIHRDIKPSNILIDVHGRPRVTDFGLAKQLTGESGLTVTGQILGTPSYMPPEQASGRIHAIGPAADIYAIGAVLYAITTGRPPFQAASSVDTLRQVIDQEPLSPRQLNSSLPIDFETIVLKCLEKSVPRRYPSAQSLADELGRFLEGKPIEARPIRKIAKIWRWCLRSPVTAGLIASLILALLSGVSVSTYFAWREGQRAVLEAAARREAQEAREIAERQRDVAQGLNELLTKEILGQADIWNQAETESKVDPDITIKASLDRAASRVSQRFAGNPEIESAVRRAIGSAYSALGEPNKGIRQLEKAMELSSALPNPSLELQREIIESEYLLAKSYWLAKRANEADAMFRGCLKKANQVLGSASRERLIVQTSLAFIHIGRDPEALTLLEELLPVVEQHFAPDDTDVLHFRNTLGLAQQSNNKMEDALSSFTLGHANAKVKLGDKNPLTMMLYNNVGRWYLINKQPARGLEVFEQLEPLVSEQLGRDNPNAILTRCNLAYCYFDVGRFEEAADRLKTIAPAMQAGLGPQNPMARTAKLTLAKSLSKLDRKQEAAALLAELAGSMSSDQPSAEIIPGLVGSAAKQLLDQGGKRDFQRLVDGYAEYLSKPKEVVGMEVAEELESIGGLFASIGDMDSAVDWTRKSLDWRLKLAPMDWRTHVTEITLGERLLSTEQAEEAERMLSQAWNALKPDLESLQAEDRDRISAMLERIVLKLQSSGRSEAVESWRNQIESVRGPFEIR